MVVLRPLLQTSDGYHRDVKQLRRSSEPEMVLTFLHAERTSSRWGSNVVALLAGRSGLLDDPNLEDEAENDERRRILGEHRGYRANGYLFFGFPDDVDWWLMSLSRTEVANLLLAREIWDDLTEATRKVGVAASNVDRVTHAMDPSVNDNIRAVAEADRAGMSFAPIIIVSVSEDATHVIVEGHTRACAYATNPGGPDVEAMVGYSTGLTGWWFWGLGSGEPSEE